jgi:hypothetical protein
MKLNILPARTGWLWVKLGLKTFFRQPLAMAGLFFMFMAVVSVASLIPLLGTMVALALLPAATLGLMAATREASGGKFPMPSILISAFRAGRQRLLAMLVLGLLYAAGFLAIIGVSRLIDGGQLASLYFGTGEGLSRDILDRPDFQMALWVTFALYLPFSLMFWHAPALVHWHNIGPVKSLFFSLVACLRNIGPLTVYGLVWLALLLAGSLLVAFATTTIGGIELAAASLVPTALLLAAMFTTSIYFTFRDTFDAGQPTSPEQQV